MMQRRLIPTSMLLIAAFGSVHCHGCKRASGGPPKVYPPPTPVAIAADTAPEPMLFLYIAPEVAPGWPWLVTAQLSHPSAFDGTSTQTFSVPAGEAAFSLVLADAQGKPVPVNFERLGTPLPAPLTIAASTRVELTWRLDPAQSSPLPVGLYSLTLLLDSPSVKAHSRSMRVNVSATPDAGPAADAIARIDDAMARGDDAAAQSAVDATLIADPTNVAALTRKGLLLEQSGDLLSAYNAIDAAADSAMTREPHAPEGGPRHLLHHLSHLAFLLDGGVY